MTGTDVGHLVDELRAAGVTLWVDSGQVRFRAPKGAMTPQRLATLKEHRDALLAHLGSTVETALVAAPEHRHEPFPVTDVQAAYLLGRRDMFAYGGVGCHGYGELTYPDLDPQRLEDAWQALIERHDMLRAIVTADGAQQVLPSTAPYRLAVTDTRGQDPARFAEAVERARDELGHKVYPPDVWPLFELRVTRGDERTVLHFSIDFLIADFVSIEVLLDELHRRYEDPDLVLPPLELTYRDYRLAEARVRSGARYERDKAYWLERLDSLPPAPDLPILPRAGQRDGTPRFQRLETRLDAATWAGLRERASLHGVSPSTAVLAAFAETIAAHSRVPRFTLDITLLNRLPLHPQVDRLVGDFTSVSLLAVDRPDPAGGDTFASRAAAAQAQLWQDLDHRLYSGVELLRELGRRRGAEAALMPVVFTSAIGLGDAAASTVDARAPRGELTHGISQTPQVWIDCQNIERPTADGAALVSNWDVRCGVLSDDLLADAFAMFEDLLHRLGTGDEAWTDAAPLRLPQAQVRRRAAANATAGPLPDGLLHDGFLLQAIRSPERLAVITGERVLTYGELAARSAAVAQRLRTHGLRRGEPVAVVMDKGWEQVVGVLGVLRAGGAYLPVDTNQPGPRRARILGDAGVRLALTQSVHTADVAGELGGETVGTVLAVDEILPIDPVRAADPSQAGCQTAAPDDLAYVIYTSGSTGTPKGVMISHRAARNTIDDVIARWRLTGADRVLGLANLGFDLSVFDIFGTLAVGAALVLPAADRRGDPSHWAALIAEHGVTVWNSVPAQLQMLGEFAHRDASRLATLRLAMLSGDWIPVALPDQIRASVPALHLVSLGGATEAGIWSIYHEIGDVPAQWSSIPYGRPLANQTFHVLDAAMRPCPDGVAGELYIGGAGLATGYLGDADKTRERFVTWPVTGERLYRTGDLGRYLSNGEIEFLGREDFQVKVRGHRIELAEIEMVLASHPAVDAAVCLADGPPLHRQLVAFVEPARREPSDVDTQTASVLTAASGAGAGVFDGVDRERYREYTRGLDDLALTAMVSVLHDAGLFRAGAAHTRDEVREIAGIASRHHRLLDRWLHTLVAQRLLERDETGRHTLTEAGTRRLAIDQADGWRRVAALGSTVDDPRLVDFFRTCSAALPSLIRGDDDPLALLFPQGRVDVSDNLYSQALFNRWANTVTATAVRQIASRHRGPGPLRVLEVGAGAGGTSASVLAALAVAREETGVDVDYLYTDLSQFFLNAAAERFAGQPGLRFAVLDLDRDVTEQGLPANAFDLIIAGDVLHATRDVAGSLRRLAGLSAPEGWLLVQEMTRDHIQIMTSLELLVRLDESIGDFADDRRGQHQTFLTPEQWQRLLAEAGLTGVASAGGDDELLDEIGMRVIVGRFKADRSRVTPEEIEAFVAQRLPGYMVPSTVEVLDALPITDNGKVDRARLLALRPARGGPAPVAESEAGSELEARIAAVWAEVLKVEHVGRQQSFYDLGGDSLLAAQLAGRLTEQVPEANLFFDELLQLILERPTVAAFADGLLATTAAQPSTVDDQEPTAASVLRLRAPQDDLGFASGLGPATAWVLVDDGTGRLPRHDALVDALGDDGPVFAVAGLDGLSLDELSPADLLERLADRYSAELGDALPMAVPVNVLAAGAGAALALGVARRLTEAGVEVGQLAILAPSPSTVDVSAATGDGALLAALRAAGGSASADVFVGDAIVLVPRLDPPATDPGQSWSRRCLGEVTVAPVPGDAVSCLDDEHLPALLAALRTGSAQPAPVA